MSLEDVIIGLFAFVLANWIMKAFAHKAECERLYHKYTDQMRYGDLPPAEWAKKVIGIYKENDDK